MARKKPVLGDVPPNVIRPVVTDIGGPSRWAFSFEYFQQINYFGLNGAKPEWFVSFLDRLKDLCRTDKEKFMRDAVLKQAYRYHGINWNAQNIPIKRSDCDWVPKEILENAEEFPFLQFQISKGNGRVVGFWDVDDTIFHIVLLDPDHNIQPSGGVYNYEVNYNNPLPCELTSLMVEIDDLKKMKCNDTNCPFPPSLTSIPTKYYSKDVFVFSLDAEYAKELKEKLQTKSIGEIIELGLLAT